MIDLLNDNAKNMLTNENLTFYKANSVDDLVDMISEIYPYSKVVVLSDKNEELTFVNNIRLILQKKLITSIIIFVKGQNFIDIDKVCDFTYIPEDVRAIVAISENVFKIAEYIASTLNLTCFYYAWQISNIDFVFQYAFIKNVDDYDIFKKPISRKVVFNTSAIKNFSINDAIRYLILRLFTILDLNVKNLLQNPKRTFDLINEVFYKSVDLILRERDGEKLLFNIINIDVYIASFGINSIKTTLEAKKMLSRNESVEQISWIFYSFRELYNAINNEKAISIPPKYELRAKLVSVYSGIKTIKCIKKLKEQIKSFHTLTELNVNFLKRYISDLKTIFDRLFYLYIKLGGKIRDLTKEEKEIIHLTGDTPLGINAMSLLREINSELIF